MASIFDSVKMTRPKSNRFDLSHDKKLSGNMGSLIPIMCMEAVPGDKFNLGSEALIRLQPLVAPMFHRLDVTMHYFFCPNRLVWKNWETFITNGKDPITGLAPAFPTVTSSFGLYNRLWDYMGVPTPLGAATEVVNAIPFAAYQKIYNEYYRDQNLQPLIACDLVDGDNAAIIDALTNIRTRAWEHDYFTSALPWAQKGDPVDIPLGEVVLKEPTASPYPPALFKQATNHDPIQGDIHSFLSDGSLASDGVPGVIDPNGTLEVSPTTVNDLRRAFRLQEWLEKNARGGTRYIENILAHFGIKSSDRRLQRPEYITGSKSPIVISEVLNTTGTTDAPQGAMAGHGIAYTGGNRGYYSCEEHGFIIGIMSVLPTTAYQQGLPKHLTKTDPTEFYWPSFANIGEQPIQNKEIYAFQGSPGEDTFGYVPRYAEYKFERSTVHGQFKTSLDHWHMARKFSSAPALNSQFISCDPTTRVFAVEDPSEDKLLCHVYNKVQAIRPMPKYGNPSF